MYRRPLLITLLTLFLTGCYAGPGYYESDVYTQPTTVVSGVLTRTITVITPPIIRSGASTWRRNRVTTPNLAITLRHRVITRHPPCRAITSQDARRAMAGGMTAFVAMAVLGVTTVSAETVAIAAGMTTVVEAGAMAAIMDRADAAMVVVDIDSRNLRVDYNANAVN